MPWCREIINRSSVVWRGCSSSLFSSHPDVLHFVVHHVLCKDHICPLVSSSTCAAVTMNNHPKEHHLLCQLTESVVKTQPVVSIFCGIHPAGKREDATAHYQSTTGVSKYIGGHWKVTHMWLPSDLLKNEAIWRPLGEVRVKLTSRPDPAITCGRNTEKFSDAFTRLSSISLNIQLITCAIIRALRFKSSKPRSRISLSLYQTTYFNKKHQICVCSSCGSIVCELLHGRCTGNPAKLLTVSTLQNCDLTVTPSCSHKRAQ